MKKDVFDIENTGGNSMDIEKKQIIWRGFEGHILP